MRKKIILLVAMQNSVHTARWVNQLVGQGWEILIFPSINVEQTHPEIRSDLVIRSLGEQIQLNLNRVGLRLAARMFGLFRRYLCVIWTRSPAARLKLAINKCRPDLIHSLEIQHAGYLALEAKKLSPESFPKWIVTNWGSDIFLFGRMRIHKNRIREVLENCDYYSCECDRDIKLAKEFGFCGITFPTFPNTGGFDLKQVESERNRLPTSARKLIMLKGYQNWAGRSLVGLRALERCADILQGYTIAIYSAPYDVEVAAEIFTANTGIPVQILKHNTPHQEMLELHAKARISIGLSISDAISTSLLEAMVMGAFPIQSSTACVDEWVQHGASGMIVPPEDPEVIEKAIRAALFDDRLVDNAAAINWQIALSRLDGEALQKQAVHIYNYVFDQSEKVQGKI